MGNTCHYFESDEWHHFVLSVIDRVWSLPEVLERCDVDNPETVLHEFTDSTDWELTDLSEVPLSTLLDESSSHLPIGIEDVRTTWFSNRQSIPEVCPHGAGDQEFCPFHRPPGEVDSELLRGQLLEAIEVEQDSPTLVGARFDSLDLSNCRIVGSDTKPIDLRYAEVTGSLNFDGAVINHDIDLFGASIATLTASETTFQGDVRAMGCYVGHGDDRLGSEYRLADNFADFQGRVDLTNATFESKADFKYAWFEPSTSFNSVSFDGLAMFNYARFGDRVDFMHTVFEQKADFSKATFDGRAILTATYGGNLMLTYTTFRDAVELWNATFSEKVDCWATDFQAGVDARHATFEGFVSFQEARFEAGGDFTGAIFADAVEWDRVETPNSVVNLSDATLSAGSIQQSPPPARFDCTRATIGDVSLSTTDERIAVFDHLRILETDFDNFDFANHRAELEDWALHRFSESGEKSPSIAELESTYLRARNGADASGDDTAASAFFLSEMRYRRQRLFERWQAADSFVETMTAFGRWMTSWFFNLTCGYGERPLRTVGVSGVAIVAFAAIYWLLGVRPAEPSVAAYLTLSLQTFVALILGGIPNADSLAVQFTGAFQAFTGAFLIALFVFALTRSIRR